MQLYRIIITSLAVLSLTISMHSQPVFETMLAKKKVVAGESFRVQYVVKNASTVEKFKIPPFKNFNLVSGPDIYKGTEVRENGVVLTTNIIVTLTAPQPGKFVLEGASALIDGAQKTSRDLFIEVLSKKDAADLKMQQAPSRHSPALVLEQGEDILEKIRQHIFLRVSVNRKTCYVGEPVVAEFKLYSQLESRSEVIKNPGFYGFGVHDVISPSDRLNFTETIDEATYDVHIIRKVQLYPLRPGTFTIDAMELDNEIFLSSQSAMDDQLTAAEPEIYNLALRTPAVDIQVKPLPAGAPAGFNGAVGSFDVNARLQKSNLVQNDEGQLIITIRGKGNLSQVGMPDVTWPALLEAFEPLARENFDKQSVPITGTKIFEVPFVGNKAGNYKIDPVIFSYFNPATRQYETIRTEPVAVNILNQGNAENKNETVTDPSTGTSSNLWIWLVALPGLFVAVFLWIKKKRPSNASVPTVEKERLPVSRIMSLPARYIDEGGGKFFAQLKDAVWMYFNERLDISGSDQTKQVLEARLREKGVDEILVDNIINLLEKCEWKIYTGETGARDESFYFAQAEAFLYKCDRYFS